MSEVVLTYLSLGGGVQSSTIAEMMVEGDISPADAVIFADTGDEPEYVYKQIKYLEGRLRSVGVPTYRVTNGNIIDDITSSKDRFAAIPAYTKNPDGSAGRLRRQCTGDYKIIPIERKVGEILVQKGYATYDKLGRIRVNAGSKVKALLGISLDEAQRMKDSSRPWIINSWPLIDRRMTRNSCRVWLTERGLPIPMKSSCRICPFHNDAYLRDMKDNRPKDWQHICRVDRSFRNGATRFEATAKGEIYLHRSLMPLDEVDLTTEKDNGQLELWDSCDEGYCFI